MLLEYLPDGSQDCPLIRLYRGSPSEKAALRDAILSLTRDQTRSIEFHALPGFSGIDGITLTGHASDRDRPIAQPLPGRFELRLRPQSWVEMADLVETLISTENGGYQWLDQVILTANSSDIALLLTTHPDGAW